MRVLVAEPALRRLLESEARLRARWPDGHQDVMVLVQTLQASGTTLADAMSTGLIKVDMPENTAVIGNVSISHRRAQLSGIAREEGGGAAIAPAVHPVRVHGITVLNVAVTVTTAERSVG